MDIEEWLRQLPIDDNQVVSKPDVIKIAREAYEAGQRDVNEELLAAYKKAMTTLQYVQNSVRSTSLMSDPMSYIYGNEKLQEILNQSELAVEGSFIKAIAKADKLK